MHCHSHCAQVADAHDAADYISAEVVKHQDLPDGIAFGVEDGRNRSEEAIGVSFVGFVGLDRLVEVEDLSEGSWLGGQYGDWRSISDSNTYLAIPQGVSLGRHCGR